MDKIQKRVHRFINASLGTSVIFFVLGLVFLLAPGQSLEIVRWVIVASALIGGLGIVVRNMMSTRYTFTGTTIIGVMLVAIGLIFALYPSVMNVFAIILGAWLIVSAISSLGAASSLRGKSDYGVVVVTSIISTICGVLLILNPWGGTISIVIVAGIVMMIHAASNMIDLLIFKKNFDAFDKEVGNFVKEAKKTFEQPLNDIEEAEVKPKKKSTTKSTTKKEGSKKKTS